MNTSTHTIDLELAKRKLYRLPGDAQEVTVRAGTVWVTLDNDPRDIILEPGESFRPDGRPNVFLYALDPARLSVRTAGAEHTPSWRAHPLRGARDLVTG